MTICLSIGTIICAWYFGRDLYLKKYPNYVSESIHLEKDPFVDFSNLEANYTIAFYLTFEAKHSLKNMRYYFPVATYFQISPTFKETFLEIIDCSEPNAKIFKESIIWLLLFYHL